MALTATVAVVGACLAAYVVVTTSQMPALRAALGRVGGLFDGQQTTAMKLNVRVLPRLGQLSGSARFSVRSNQANRSRFYFLLNPGLRLRSTTATRNGGVPVAVSAYQVALVLVLVPERPLGEGESLDVTLEYEGKPWIEATGGAGLLNDRDILLNVDAFWYPVDAQSFFDADVTVRLPRSMTLVHDDPEATESPRGEEQEVHWRSGRPIAGLALIAGPYTRFDRRDGATGYRLFVPDDIHLDSERTLSLMSAANRELSDRLGPSGFETVSIFVSRNIRRGFNDGSGVIGLSLRYFRSPDYAFGLIAHEIAHNWWGGTVTGGWLTPGRGAQWVVEGFAEFSSLVATETHFDRDAVTERLLTEFFDPARQQTIADMSVLDNAFDEPRARDTIYRKGAYVLWMLRQTIGDEACFKALRELVERFRYRHVSDTEIESVFRETSGVDLGEFFGDWVRGNARLDLSLDPVDTDRVKLNNLGTAHVPGPVDVWTVSDSGEISRAAAAVGDTLSVPANTSLIVDPQLTWADVSRENNRFPRREDPLSVAAGPDAQLALAIGDPFPWGRTAIAHTGADGRPLHTWELSRGLMQPPSWAATGKWLVASVANQDDLVPNVVALNVDNAQNTLGKGGFPAPGSGTTIYATRGVHLLRFADGKPASDLVRVAGKTVEAPAPSPDGRQVAYVAAKQNGIDLRLIDSNGANDVSLLTWDRDRMVTRWSPDGRQLYVVIGGDADWQIWAITVGAGEVKPLVRDAAVITDLAVSKDGDRLAFTGAESSDYPHVRRQLFVLDLRNRSVRTVTVADTDLSSVDWEGADSLVVVGTPYAPGQPVFYPRKRALYRVRPSTGESELIR